MSLILDALQRSEREQRSGETVPGLHTQHEILPERPTPILQRSTWLLAVVIVLLVLLAILLWPGQSDPSVVPVVKSEIPRDVAVQPERAVLPTQALEQQPEAEPPTTARVTSTSNAVAALYDKPDPQPTKAETAFEQPSITADSSPVESNSESPIDIEAVAAAAQQELDAVALTEHPAPLISSLPQSLKDQIPSIFYRRHDWSPQAAARLVNLNGQDFSEGEQVASGLVLVEILADSCVLDFQGNQFRLKALNSWINL